MRAFLLIFCLSSLSALAQPAPWVLDVDASELVVKVWKTGAAASLAHDHVVRAPRFTGTASLDDSGKPESLRLQLKADATALIPDEPAMRRRHNLPNTPLTEVDLKTVTRNMLGDGQLDVEKYPSIDFEVTRVFREESGALKCAGRLTLHGVTRELLFEVEVKSGDRRMEAKAQVRFKTSDFGIKPYSAALGLIRNQDTVELAVHLVVKR